MEMAITLVKGEGVFGHRAVSVIISTCFELLCSTFPLPEFMKSAVLHFFVQEWPLRAQTVDVSKEKYGHRIMRTGTGSERDYGLYYKSLGTMHDVRNAGNTYCTCKRKGTMRWEDVGVAETKTARRRDV